jgi:hypothetical protein
MVSERVHHRGTCYRLIGGRGYSSAYSFGAGRHTRLFTGTTEFTSPPCRLVVSPLGTSRVSMHYFKASSAPAGRTADELACPTSIGRYIPASILPCPAVSYSKGAYHSQTTVSEPSSRYLMSLSWTASISPFPNAVVLGMWNLDRFTTKPSSSHRPRYDRHLCERRKSSHLGLSFFAFAGLLSSSCDGLCLLRGDLYHSI